MCGVCGCGEGEVRIEGRSAHDHGEAGVHEHVLTDGRVIRHRHGEHDPRPESHQAPTAVDVSSPGRARLIAVERDILERNAANARHNRAHFAAARVTAVNLVSSPGAGKTTLLVETIAALRGAATPTPLAVIEGDQQTSNDAERIRAAGAPAVQVNTGKGCHLEADMVHDALHHLPEPADGFLFIENVGNLVCPAGFDLGEAYQVVIASVTEGEDKPLKYPDIFASADLMIVSKADLAPHTCADVDLLIANARRVKPDLPALVVSARSGQGMDRWIGWLHAARAMHVAAL